MKKYQNLKQKIILYVMSVSILITVLITTIMSMGSIRSTNAVLLDNMQITARIAAQNISSNLHLLTERMYNFSTEAVFTEQTADNADRQARFDAIKLQIEFVWLSAYDTNGKKLYGDTSAPDSISDTKYYSMLSHTGSIVIGEPYCENDILQLCVGVPLQDEEGVTGYLVGSYKYDILNDVLSQLVLGNSGTACILNEQGDIIGDQDLQNIIDGKNVYDLYSSAANAADFDKVTAFQVGSATMKLNGIRHYTGYAPIPGTNWALFINAPKHEFMNTVYLSTALSVVLSVLLLIIAAIVIVPVSRRISDPLSSVARRLQALSDGNLTDHVLVSCTIDETAVLTGALSKTITSLKGYIQDIESCLSALSSGDYTIRIPDDFRGDFASIRDSLGHITAALNRTMLRMSRSSAEVSDCARQLLDGSREQSLLLQDMEQNMSAITASIEQNKENVLRIEQCAETAGEKTALGDSYMQNMLNAMSQIHTTVNEISNISLLIENISRQTNLLSLNASVEAARAGEAGRGFAVVANEIGELSNQTADALRETSSLIERSAETIQTGLETADLTAATFQEIAELTQQYRNISSQLAETVRQQTDAVTGANNKLATLQNIAGKNDTMAAESLAQAQTLRDYVSQVKINQSM